MQGTDLRKNHLPSLTGLRFFAASMVVLLHAAQRFDPISGMTHVVGFGYIGVSFFFMLSGFILAWTAREVDSPMQFYWRRFARVWPLHALTWVRDKTAGRADQMIGSPITIATIIANPVGFCLGISIQRGWRPPFTMRQAC